MFDQWFIKESKKLVYRVFNFHEASNYYCWLFSNYVEDWWRLIISNKKHKLTMNVTKNYMNRKFSRKLCRYFHPIWQKMFDAEFIFLVIRELVLSLSVGISLLPITVLDHTVELYLIFSSPRKVNELNICSYNGQFF